jgi:tetratricopeptide (TPR) repeat protein
MATLQYKNSLSRYRKYLQTVQNQPLLKASLFLILSLVLVIILIATALQPTLTTIADLIGQISKQKTLEQKMDAKISALQEAQKQFVAALAINPDNLGAIFNLVKIAYETKSFNDAAYFLRNYISNHEPNINILYSYSGVLYHQGEHALAQKEVERILNLNPNHAGAKELQELLIKNS